MARTVLIDSGAIVAALSDREQLHPWAKLQFEALTEPPITCEAVLSECFHLLERTRRGKEALCALIERGLIGTAFSFDLHTEETIQLMRRYKDTPMSFADACLVRMAELHNDPLIFTTDSDFAIYRKNGRQMIPLITPW
jgi:predicted nucleic acid-binding protein